MTKEEIISMLSKELNSEWTNGVTCLMVENSDSYIPVIVHHNKNELIVEVGEQDKKIYRIGRNELNKHLSHHQKIIEISHNLTHGQSETITSISAKAYIWMRSRHQ